MSTKYKRNELGEKFSILYKGNDLGEKPDLCRFRILRNLTGRKFKDFPIADKVKLRKKTFILMMSRSLLIGQLRLFYERD